MTSNTTRKPAKIRLESKVVTSVGAGVCTRCSAQEPLYQAETNFGLVKLCDACLKVASANAVGAKPAEYREENPYNVLPGSAFSGKGR